MRKIIRLFICLLICVFLGNIEVFASTKTFERNYSNNYLINKDIEITDYRLNKILETPAVDSNEKIYDFADLFTDSEEDELYSIISDYIDEFNLDLAIVTVDNNGKSSTKEYAMDFYNYNDFGFNGSYDGLLFLIDMDNREFYMTTTGQAITMYTDERIDRCLDVAFEYIANEEYFSGTEKFIEELEWFADVGEPDEYGNEPRVTGVVKIKIMPWGNIILFSTIGTAVVMCILVFNNKLVHKANSSRQYLVNSDIHVVKDMFLGRSVHRSARYHDSSSGGGSSGGRSISHGSSGMSHGGGGRKF